MRRIAIFVEGQTELVFVERLLTEVAGAHNVIIEQRRIRGGTNAPRAVITLSAAREATNESFFALIVDCGGDAAVKARIIEEHENLTRSGYELVIGMRDVRPDFTANDIPKLRVGLRKYIKTALAPVIFILSIMEIEAWFLAEHTHFQRINPAITREAIVGALAFDPVAEDMSLRPLPTEDMKNAYALGDETYEKGGRRTINALDFEHLYLQSAHQNADLNSLISEIERFVT